MRRWAGRLAASMGVGALFLATGCGTFFVYPGSLNGTGTGSTGTGDYVYVANSTTETLTGYAVSAGALTAVTNSPYSLGFLPMAVAVNPADTLVFVSGSDGTYGYIDVFQINADGGLTLLMDNNVGASNEISMDVSPDGNWLVGLDSNGPLFGEVIVDEYSISGSNGQLTQQIGGTYTYQGSPQPTIVPHVIKFAPNEAYVFAAVGTAGDLVFPFSSGTLSTPLALLFGAGSSTSDNALAVNAASTTLYIARSGVSGGLAVYSIGVGGALSEASGSPLPSGNQPLSVVLNQAGTYVYVGNQVDATISGYSISSTGAVAALSPATDSLVSAPRALAIDNSGSYLLSMSNVGSPDLAMYSYDSTTPGKLDFSTSTATGNDPAGAIAMAATH